MKSLAWLSNLPTRWCLAGLALFWFISVPAGLRAMSLPSGEVRLLTSAGPGPASRPDRILVKPKAGVDLSVLTLQVGATVMRTFPDIGNLQILQLPAGTPVLSVLNLFRTSPLVEYAEPDYIVHLLKEPNDFRYWDGSLWGLHNTGNYGGAVGADMKAPAGWDLQTSAAGIVVAVIDTGIRATHEDLAGSLWTNPGETGLDAQGRDKATNGVDDDGDGYVDDVHGINAITGSGNPADDHGHGSHVSGIIAGTGNNSVGIVGAAWNAQVMSCKFIDATGNGAISDAITCIDYARSKGARIINASWGSTSFNSQALYDAIASARNAGILFVAAAGNSTGDNDTAPLYPASYPLDNIISVASTNRNDGLSAYSNYGAKSVHLGAPGEDIFSCWFNTDSDYIYESGTSMSAGYVSGVAALVMAHFPGENYAAVRQRILAGTDPLPALQGKTITGGRLDLFQALGGTTPPPPPPPAQAPAAPSSLSATATSSSAINLTWTDNASNEDGFRVERSPDNVSFTQIASLGANTTTYADTGLTAGTTYYYRVLAFNAAGNSAYSNTANATTQTTPPPPPPPAQPPAAPSNLSATAASSSAINLTWTDNSDNEQGFQLERSLDGTSFSSIAMIDRNTTAYSDINLSANTTYYYRLAAFNNAGNSAYSNIASATTQTTPPPPPPPPAQPPAAPGNLGATATSSSAINLTWTDNASNEDGFAVERSTDNASFTQVTSLGANTTSYSDGGLAASTTYYYRVRAFNSAGNSGYSNTANATTQAAPPPPPPPSVASVSVQATVPLASDVGPVVGVFTISRTGATDASLTVHYSLGGTAINGTDYQALNGTTVIPAGAASVTVQVTPLNDHIAVEPPETVILTLSPDPGYSVGQSNSATVTIIDTDLIPLPGIL